MYRFLLRLENGEPPEPAVFVTVVPDWIVGETFSVGRGDRMRILAIDTDLPDELVDEGFNAVFTVEPRERRGVGRPWGDTGSGDMSPQMLAW